MSNTMCKSMFKLGDTSGVWLRLDVVSEGLNLVAGSSNWNSSTTTNNTVLSSNTWYSFAVTQNSGISTTGSSGQVGIFLNGTRIDQNTVWRTAEITSNRLTIGTDYLNNGSTDFRGYMDDIRCTKWVARYSSIYTPLPCEYSENGPAVTPTPSPSGC